MDRAPANLTTSTDSNPGEPTAPLDADRQICGPGNPYVMLRDGIHPATRLPLLSVDGPAATCGGCAMRYERATSRGLRNKCSASPFRARGGADVPADFPACSSYTAAQSGNEAPVLDGPAGAGLDARSRALRAACPRLPEMAVSA